MQRRCVSLVVGGCVHHLVPGSLSPFICPGALVAVLPLRAFVSFCFPGLVWWRPSSSIDICLPFVSTSFLLAVPLFFCLPLVGPFVSPLVAMLAQFGVNAGVIFFGVSVSGVTS